MKQKGIWGKTIIPALAVALMLFLKFGGRAMKGCDNVTKSTVKVLDTALVPPKTPKTVGEATTAVKKPKRDLISLSDAIDIIEMGAEAIEHDEKPVSQSKTAQEVVRLKEQLNPVVTIGFWEEEKTEWIAHSSGCFVGERLIVTHFHAISGYQKIAIKPSTNALWIPINIKVKYDIFSRLVFLETENYVSDIFLDISNNDIKIVGKHPVKPIMPQAVQDVSINPQHGIYLTLELKNALDDIQNGTLAVNEAGKVIRIVLSEGSQSNFGVDSISLQRLFKREIGWMDFPISHE